MRQLRGACERRDDNEKFEKLQKEAPLRRANRSSRYSFRTGK
jgi:hypothetical protein